MNKKILLIAVVALGLTACSNEVEEMQGGTTITDQPVVTNNVPMAFGAYVNRATTRAGASGVLTNDGADGTVSLKTQGFGVFAYHTDDKLYSPIYQPNFMYNNWVHNDGGDNWTYEPVRYWPNETGANAVSANVDRLSFFAYAPYVPVNHTTGVIDTSVSGLDLSDPAEIALANNTGIVGMSRNGAVGDPMVMYYVSLDPTNQVDFSWGVVPDAYTLGTSDASTTNIVTAGSPFLNIVKPMMNEKIQFDFKHALTALNIQLDSSAALDANTKVYVRQISFEGFAMKGMFNLNTDRAIWYDLSGKSFLEGTPVHIYDGRINGREARGANPN